MKILRVWVAIGAIILLGGVGYYAYLGGFHSVDVKKSKFGPAEIVYELHRGPYKDLGPAWAEFFGKLRESGMDQCSGLAIYPDPPGTDESQLRSFLACRLDTVPAGLQKELRQKFPSFTIPEAEVLEGSFPYKNHLSYFLGPSKVYPKLGEAAKAENTTPPLAIEVYGAEGQAKELKYLMPISLPISAFQALLDAKARP